ncbi:nucleotide disphospho-sugar-binding domain-containing protein [Polymorphospora sp. NPDC051019]|uniref:glycosyltransferase n=1 Tax=Polymorphospora sp. NPDC051019 TaxID=3155725 RepID=UPI003436C47C
MAGKRIMVFTIPNDGHLNILKRMIRAYRAEHTFRLVLVDRQTTAPDLGDLAGLTDTLDGSRHFVNTPASGVLNRVCELLDESLAITRDFGPDLVVHDFCALEGHFAARLAGVPYWASVPGLIGPMTDRRHLADCLSSPTNRAATETLRRRYGLTVAPGDVELVSNSLHIPAPTNLLWSYPAVTPADFRHHRRPAHYRFAGYLSDGHRRPARPAGRPLVYLSFGTEVMDNLWHADPTTRDGVRRCVAGLAARWTRDVDVVFVTRGRPVLPTYPANWAVHDRVDQQRILSRADVFVTHGGSNSFHEALLARVPVVVVPFFGDQPLVARRAAELGVGIALDGGATVERGAAARFLHPDLPALIAAAVDRIRADGTYRRNLRDLCTSVTPALAGVDRLHPTGPVRGTVPPGAASPVPAGPGGTW